MGQTPSAKTTTSHVRPNTRNIASCSGPVRSGPAFNYFHNNLIHLFFFYHKYVLQNGSLLIVEENFEAYEVQSDYCLDEGLEGLYAIVCIHSKQAHVLRGEAVIYAVCLWLSVPCLLITAFFYLKIDSLRELHGRSLSA